MLAAFILTFTTTTIASGSGKEQTIFGIAAAHATAEPAGDVMVSLQDIDGVKYVVGTIIIDEQPEKVWQTLVNPFEFAGKICPHLKKVDMLTDKYDIAVIEMTYAVIFPFPDLKYVVESRYEDRHRIEFHRVSGAFKDFRGFWNIGSLNNGESCLVTYSMYLDPGMPLPDWLIRLGVRHELPAMLRQLKQRITDLKDPFCPKAKHFVQAACPGPVAPTVAASSTAAVGAPFTPIAPAPPASLPPDSAGNTSRHDTR